MDTSNRKITFDENGVCNHCKDYKTKVQPHLLSLEKAKFELNKKVQEIKDAGKGEKYDVILGLSGGVDSSYLAYVAKQQGLRPLLVHLNNGWDAEFAKRNIEKIVNKTEFDYFQHTLNWEEFKDLQIAYLRASVVDIEAPTDHAIAAVVWGLAEYHDVKYVLSGVNSATESFMPYGWNYPKLILANLLAIHEKFGKTELKSFPTLGLNKTVYYMKVKGIQEVGLLDACEYNIKKAKQQLKDEFDWEDYPRKHYESIFTKFYQSYILPVKFGIDKRRVHLSNLIFSNQMTRGEALQDIEEPLYSTEEELMYDYGYIIQKLGLRPQEFEEIMALPIVSHYSFPGDEMTAETKALLKKEGK